MTFEQAMAWHQAGRPADETAVLAGEAVGRDVLEDLSALRAMLEDLGRRERDAIDRARAEGRTWAEIGAALGVSAQAVQKRVR